MPVLRRAWLWGRLRALPASLLGPTPGLAAGSAAAHAVEGDLVWMTVRNARALIGGFLFLIVLFTVEFFDPTVSAPVWTWRAITTSLMTQAVAWRVLTSALLAGYLLWDAHVRRQRRSERADSERRLASASVWVLLGSSALYTGHSLWEPPLLMATMVMYVTVAVLLHPPGRTGPMAYLGAAIVSVAICYGLPGLGAPSPAPQLQLWSLLPALALLALMLWRVTHVGHVRRLAGRRAFQEVLHDLRRTRRQLALSARAAGEAAERERISRDLHDHVGGRRTALLCEAEAARRDSSPEAALQAVEAGARETLNGLRETVWTLHHESLTVGTLGERIERFASARARPHGVTVTLERFGDDSLDLSPDRALHLFRIAQEAVTNALKHAGASALTLRLGTEAGRVLLSVADDGRFRAPADAGDDPPGGFGLPSMAGRAGAIGGTFQLDTDGATTIRVDVPAHHVPLTRH